MNFLKKKRKEEVFANGKIVIVDFSELNPDGFLYNDQSLNFEEQLAVLSYDGKFFVNRMQEEYEYLSNIFQILICEPRYNLDQFAKYFKKRYPNISFSNWSEMQEDNKEKTYVLAALLIPAEIKRRQIERAYYNKK